MRVKIKKKTKPGDQLDYGLVVGNVYGHINEDAQPKDPLIKNTISKVPRSEANIEAEGGETVLFEKDGSLQHSKVVGKRHSQGGVPLNVPDGSFLFSDTRKLKIKDKDTLDYFDKSRPTTPAKIAKKYDLNYYNQVLLDPDADSLDKETAKRMLSNNKRKLSELAMVQEGMKGFPNGVPSFTENLQEAQYGGMIKDHKKIHLPIPMQEGGKKIVHDQGLKQYGAVGRTLSNWGENIYDFFSGVGDFLVERGKSSLEAAGTLSQPEREIWQRTINDSGKGFYNLFLNPEENLEPTKTIQGKPLPTSSSKVLNPLVKQDVSKMKDLEDFQKGGFKDEPKIGPNGENFTVRVYQDGTRVLLNEKGLIINSKQGSPSPVSQPGNISKNSPEYMQYQLQELINSNKDDLILTNLNLSGFGTQSKRPDGTFAPSGDLKFDFNDFKVRHGEFLKSLGYDPDQFIADIQNPATSEKTTRFFQNEFNKEFKKRYGKDYFTPENGEPYGTDGQFGVITFSAPGFKMKTNTVPDAPIQTPEVKVQAPVAVGEPLKSRVIPNQGFADQGVNTNDGWWLQDIAAFTGTMLDRTQEIKPKRQQVNLQTVDSTLVDPTRQIAAIQEQSSRFQDLAMNTSSGQVARANVLANSGQAAGQIADVIANYENQNANIVNTTDATNANIINQETMTNTELDDQYMQRLAIMRQQKINADRELNNRRLAAFVKGTTNNMKKKLMDQVLFPNYAINPITFDMEFKGQGDRSMFNDTYINPQFGAMGTQDPMSIVRRQAEQAIANKKALLDAGYSKDDAEWALQQFGRNIRPDMVGANNLFNLQTMYNQIF